MHAPVGSIHLLNTLQNMHSHSVHYGKASWKHAKILNGGTRGLRIVCVSFFLLLRVAAQRKSEYISKKTRRQKNKTKKMKKNRKKKKIERKNNNNNNDNKNNIEKGNFCQTTNYNLDC